MLIVAAWIVFALGIVHCLLGLVRFKKPFTEAVIEGFYGKFAGIPERRLAFWFTIFGLMLVMCGHLAVLAVTDGNMALLRVIGIYLLAVSVLGAAALPKSPFSFTVFLAGFIVAGSFGFF